MRKVVVFHLFNDFSGSPKVLSMVIQGFLERGYEIDLITSDGGVLDELAYHERLHKKCIKYSFSTNPIVTILRYVFVQIVYFFYSLHYWRHKNIIFYINTIMPVGAALSGCLIGKKIIYHYHENAFVKGILYKLLACMMQRLADEIICVSDYQSSFLKRQKKVTVIPNALPKEFVVQLHPDQLKAFKRKTILMLSSLKKYKGTCEFIQLAEYLPQFKFVLVINDTQAQIDNYLAKNCCQLPKNIVIIAQQKDVTSFYNNASLVLNLSKKDLAIETFGMTVLEAMTAGLPVIVPTVGGIAEMVFDGENGYKIDVMELNRIKEVISYILTDQHHYEYLSSNALRYSQKYDCKIMIYKILAIIDNSWK